MADGTFPELASDRAYARADVERYLAAADRRRQLLRARIAEAQERLERAGAVAAVLLDASFELQRIRHDAEVRAAEIVADADRHAAALLRGDELILPDAGSPGFAPLDNNPNDYFEFLRTGLSGLSVGTNQPLELGAE